MPNFTARFGMTKPLTSELYDVGVPNANADIMDAAIDRVCTASTRPSTAYIGLRVFETDTKAVIVCTSVGPIVWRYVTQPIVANAAARNALAPVHAGMTVQRLDTGYSERYDGSVWNCPHAIGLVAESVLTSNSATFSLTEINVWQLAFTSIGTTRRYRFEADCCIATTGATAGPNLTMAFRWRAGAGAVISTDPAVWVSAPSCQGSQFVNKVGTGSTSVGFPAGTIQIAIGCSASNSMTSQIVAGANNMRSFRVYDEGI